MNKNKLLSILIVLIFAVSCKSQSILKEKNILFKIKDSIVCRGKIKRIYNLPYVNLHNKERNKKINSIILSDVEDQLSWFDNFDNTKDLRGNFKQFIEDSQKECCKYLSPLESTYYEIGFYKRDAILSLKLSLEIYSGNLHVEEYFYNFDLKNGNQFSAKNIFKNNSQELISIINKKIKKRLNTEINGINLKKTMIIESNLINSTPQWYYITQENKEPGIEILINNNWEALNISSILRVFYSFEELKPYLTDEFKKQLDIH